MKIELVPCKKCGSKEVFVTTTLNCPSNKCVSYAFCSDCRKRTRCYYGKYKEAKSLAVAEWNECNKEER